MFSEVVQIKFFLKLLQCLLWQFIKRSFTFYSSHTAHSSRKEVWKKLTMMKCSHFHRNEEKTQRLQIYMKIARAYTHFKWVRCLNGSRTISHCFLAIKEEKRGLHYWRSAYAHEFFINKQKLNAIELRVMCSIDDEKFKVDWESFLCGDEQKKIFFVSSLF